MVVAAALIQPHPRALARLEFDRCAIAAGEWWRLLTGHLVHYGWPHLAADMGVFVALSWIARRRSSGILPVALLSALIIGAAVYLWEDGIIVWRGMSGVDAALFGWVLVIMAAQDRGWRAAVYGGLLLLAIGRFAFETVTGRGLLPTSLPEGVAVVGLAHVVGLAVGCGLAGLGVWRGSLINRRTLAGAGMRRARPMTPARLIRDGGGTVV
jgi:rhomboid family GlyGly-CTERM serine protease